MRTGFSKRILSLSLVSVIAGGILYFIVRSVARDWPLIVSYPWQFSWFSLISSVILAILSMLLAIKASHKLLSTLGGNISFTKFMYIFSVAQLGRYLPGRIWHLVSFALLIEREGVTRTVSVIVPLLLQVIMVAVLGLTGALLSSALLMSQFAPPVTWLAGLATMAIVVGLFLLPFLWRRVGHFMRSTFKEIKGISLPPGGYFSALGLLALSSLALSGAFFLFISGLIDVAGENAFIIGGIFLLSYVAGWVTVIVPGGLGVREGALAFLLSSLIAPAVSSIVALAARLWLTGAEGILFLGVWIWADLVKGERLSLRKPDSGTDGSAV